MSESTGKGHQVPDSTSLSIRLATEYNEPTVPGTTEIVPSTKELTETTTAPGGLVQHTMASQKQSVCGSLSSPAVSGDVPRPLVPSDSDGLNFTQSGRIVWIPYGKFIKALGSGYPNLTCSLDLSFEIGAYAD